MSCSPAALQPNYKNQVMVCKAGGYSTSVEAYDMEPDELRGMFPTASADIPDSQCDEVIVMAKTVVEDSSSDTDNCRGPSRAQRMLHEAKVLEHVHACAKQSTHPGAKSFLKYYGIIQGSKAVQLCRMEAKICSPTVYSYAESWTIHNKEFYTCRIAGFLIEALSFLHEECHVVHGDLSPKNMLVSDGNVWVIDFGNAYGPADTELQCVPIAVSRVLMMPPWWHDCAYPWELDYADDVWATGIMLLEVLNGTTYPISILDLVGWCTAECQAFFRVCQAVRPGKAAACLQQLKGLWKVWRGRLRQACK